MSGTSEFGLEAANEVGSGQDAPLFLILASGQAAEEVAHALETYLHARVRLVDDYVACLQAFQGEPVTLLLVEESAATADPAAIDVVYEAAGTTVLVEANLGIVDATRLVRQVRAALRQRHLEKERAKAAVRAEIRQELVTSLTGLLLESQLGLRQASPALMPTLQRLVGLAEHLCGLLRDPQSGTETTVAENSIRRL